MPTAEVTLPATVRSVPAARHFVESILSGWGLRDLSWTATLITSELAANAALHARGGAFSIRVTSDGSGGARLEVDDSSQKLPQTRTYSRESTTGRGLRLVSDLSHEWGVTPGTAGKTVWAVLLPAPPGVDDDDDIVDVDALLDAFAYDADVGPREDRHHRPDATALAGLEVAA